MSKPVPLGVDAHLMRKHELGGMMNLEEARMNKGLLKEIAKRKAESPESRKNNATPARISPDRITMAVQGSVGSGTE